MPVARATNGYGAAPGRRARLVAVAAEPEDLTPVRCAASQESPTNWKSGPIWSAIPIRPGCVGTSEGS